MGAWVGWSLLIVLRSFVGRKATSTIKAVNRMASLAHHDHLVVVEMRENVNKYKEESARVRWLSFRVVYYFC